MSYDILFQRAITLFEGGNLVEAEAICRSILDTNPNNADVLTMLGLIAQNKELHPQAIELFYSAIQQTPSFAPLHFNIAVSLEAEDKDVEAAKSYKRAIELNPNFKEAYNALGKLTGDKTYFQKAVEIDPDYEEAKLNLSYLNAELSEEEFAIKSNDELLLGSLKLKEGKQNDAEEIFRNYLKSHPKSVPALINLANIETLRKEYDLAEEKYKKALNINRQSLDAHINYANMLYQQKRLIEALEEYRQAIIINPNVAEVSNNLGLILKDLGEYEEALGLLINAYLKRPDLDEISINIFETIQLLNQKDPDLATKIFDNWQRLNPGFNLKKLFDQFAETYNQTLEKINYTVPQKMSDILGDLEGPVIDLGCGTGLLGERIKNNKNKLIGVDISPKMLEFAKQKGIYDELIETDIIEYLTNHSPQSTAHILAADVFCYFQDLEPIIKLCSGHHLCFSIETIGAPKSLSRFQHSKKEVENLLKKHGFAKISKYPLVLRHENGEPVNGIIFDANQ